MPKADPLSYSNGKSWRQRSSALEYCMVGIALAYRK